MKDRRLWPLLLLPLLVLGVMIAGRSTPPASNVGPGLQWTPLEPGLGRICWIETRMDPTVQPPTVPPSVAPSTGTASAASFGSLPGSDQAAAWYLIQSAAPALELWHLDKASVKLTDADGKPEVWEGGSGASLVNSEQRLQYLYLVVPRHLSRTGARIEFRVSQFNGRTSAPVRVPL